MNNIDDILKDYVTTSEAAKLYHVSSRSIRDLIYANKVDYITVDYKGGFGFKYMVSIDSLRRIYTKTPEEVTQTPWNRFRLASYKFFKSLLGIGSNV